MNSFIGLKSFYLLFLTIQIQFCFVQYNILPAESHNKQNDYISNKWKQQVEKFFENKNRKMI